jgi:hypothetical protein
LSSRILVVVLLSEKGGLQLKMSCDRTNKADGSCNARKNQWARKNFTGIEEI